MLWSQLLESDLVQSLIRLAGQGLADYAGVVLLVGRPLIHKEGAQRRPGAQSHPRSATAGAAQPPSPFALYQQTQTTENVKRDSWRIFSQQWWGSVAPRCQGAVAGDGESGGVVLARLLGALPGAP